MIIYMNPAFYVFLTTLAAFMLLLLVTISVPVVTSFYFLYSSESGGIRFGIWGWCLDSDGTCSWPLKLGYTRGPEIATSTTGGLVFYPSATVIAFITMISLMPVLCARTKKTDIVFNVLAWASVASSALAFLFAMGVFTVAKYRFEQNGDTASFGNLLWMSLAAMFLLLAVAVSPYFSTPPPKESRKSRRSHSSRSHSSRSHMLHETDLEARPSRKREFSRQPTGV